MRTRHPALGTTRAPLLGIVLAVALTFAAPAGAASQHMTFVGSLAPWPEGQYSNVAADAARHVAYLGSWDDQGVAVIDTRDPANPVMTEHVSTHITSDLLISDSADLDLVGRYLAVSHQRLTRGPAFEGISIYDTGPDPYHPVLLRRVEIPGGVHTVQLDPEVASGRPYAYANSEGSYYMYIVNIETGGILGQFAASEGIGCVPAPSFCLGFNFAHEGFIQRHPRSGRVLDYVSFWDGGLRIVDVTDPSHPTEVGAFDYNRLTNGLTSAHYAAATPSGNWVYLEDEIGYVDTGGVHILDTSACDGTSRCTPSLVGDWHIQGHPIQASAIHGTFHGNGNQFLPTLEAAGKRSYSYDAHNLDLRGEDELLVANYSMGIRLIDTSDKTAPTQKAFYLPNGNEGDACKMDCSFNARQTWGAYFGTDGRIYASDLQRGFYIVDPSGPAATAGSVAMAAARVRAATRGTTASPGGALFLSARTSDGGDPTFAFTLSHAADVALRVYDVQGRFVATPAAARLAPGPHAIQWRPHGSDGRPLSRGIYFVRLESGTDAAAAKFVVLGR